MGFSLSRRTHGDWDWDWESRKWRGKSIDQQPLLWSLCLSLSVPQGIFSSASGYLHEATFRKVYFHRVIIVLPPTWDSRACGRSLPASHTSASLVAKAEFRIGGEHPLFGHAPFTQQSLGCQKPGDFISMGYQYLMQYNDTGHGTSVAGTSPPLNCFSLHPFSPSPLPVVVVLVREKSSKLRRGRRGEACWALLLLSISIRHHSSWCLHKGKGKGDLIWHAFPGTHRSR